MKKEIIGIETRQNQLKEYLKKISPSINLNELDELVAAFIPDEYPKKYLLLK